MAAEIVEHPAAIPAAVAPERPRRPALESLRHILAMLLLPLSIAPVLLLGPSLLRAPVALFHEGWGEVVRLEARLLPAHPRPAPLGEYAWALPAVSLGPVYGRWLSFPEQGRARPADPQLGPEGLER
jgi:hypothetical protein